MTPEEERVKKLTDDWDCENSDHHRTEMVFCETCVASVIHAAVKEEREACAKVAENVGASLSPGLVAADMSHATVARIVAEIRGRR